MSRCHANYLLLLVLFGGLFVSASLAKTPYTDEVSPREDRDTVTNGDGSVARMIQHPRYKWTRSDHTIALLNHDRVVWQFNYGRSASKPNFHPLALLDGTDLSCQSTTNHTHHHALWFAWKMLNGVNYWEENPQTGLSDGLTELVNAKITPGKNHSARMDLTLTYHPPGAPPLLTEARTIIVSPPDKNGEYYIDWEGTFTAGKEEVVLKGGTSGGGYAGMSARISEHSHDWHLMDSEGREDGPSDFTAKNTHGKRASWADFSLVDNATNDAGGITIFQHPSSFRYPAQWHNAIDLYSKAGPFGYFSPATLWSEPYTMGPGKSFTMRYRILVHPGKGNKEKLETAWKKYIK